MDAALISLYGEEQLEYQKERYAKAQACFEKLFGNKKTSIYSAPGRTEIVGNHTDHQSGHVLAAAVNLDAIAVVAPLGEAVIRLVSGDGPMLEVDISDLSVRDEEKGSTQSLIRGVAYALKNYGYRIGGFECYVSSDVIIGSGLSSSAAFETLIGTVISGLYNDMTVSATDIAKSGQIAENQFFGKPSGLMDQMACSTGGFVYIDFYDNSKPVVKKINSDFEKKGYSICIVDTKGSHADLTEDYASIPADMKKVAKYFGKEKLRYVDDKQFVTELPKVIKEVGGKATARGLHFFSEQKRVTEAVKALENDDFSTFLNVVQKSGDSSAKYLQNIYSTKNADEQNITIALAVTQSVIGDKGVCRVHGGGFAGTIQTFVRNEVLSEYVKAMDDLFGEGSVRILKVREAGGVCVRD